MRAWSFRPPSTRVALTSRPNRSYNILQNEMRNVGVVDFGENAKRMLNLDDPELDFVAMARGMGVDGGVANTVKEFTTLMDTGLRQKGPFLIQANI